MQTVDRFGMSAPQDRAAERKVLTLGMAQTALQDC